MTRDDLLHFKSGKYVPANTVVTFAGKVDHDACVERVTAAMADVQRRPMPRSIRFTGEMKGEPATLTSKAIEQTHVALGIRLFGRLDRRRHALKLLNTVLGENMSSRLFQVVRERHGLAYSIHSDAHLYTDTGMLVISAGLDRQRVEKALALVFKELDRFRKRPLSASELKRARDYAIGQLRLGLESTMNQMMWMGENLLVRGRVIDPEESIRAIEAVSAADVQKLATTFFRRKNMSLAMVTPRDSEMTETALADYVKAF